MSKNIPLSQNQQSSLKVMRMSSERGSINSPQNDGTKKWSSFVYSPIVLGSPTKSEATIAAQKYLLRSSAEISTINNGRRNSNSTH